MFGGLGREAMGRAESNDMRRMIGTGLGLLLSASIVVSCGPDVPAVDTGAEQLVDGYANVLVTTGDGAKLLSVEPRVPIANGPGAAAVVVDIDRSARYQSMAGVGAAMTDSSAWVLSTRLNDVTRTQVINDLFGRRGANLSVVRVPLSSTDFSLDDFTYDDIELPGEDPDLTAFSLAREEQQRFPLLRAALAVNPDLTLIGSAWTAPGWMKSGASADRLGVVGGTLADGMTEVYSRYLRRVVDGYADAGVPLALLTVQNEPAHETDNYAGMVLSPQQEADLAIELADGLQADGSSTELLVHDHNWNGAPRALDVLARVAGTPRIAGSAFHCYSGNPSAQSTVHNAYPDLDIHFTECTGTESSGTFESNLLWNARVLLVDSVRNWSRSVVLWNLALDERSGPRVGGCRNCRGVLTIHPDGHVTRNEEFYALAQFGRGVDVGATRIGSSSATGGVHNVVFENPDGSTVAFLVSTASQPVDVAVTDGDRSVAVTLPARSVVTLRWA